MVPLAGIGPATSPLPRECSTTEPHGLKNSLNDHRTLERETGIEPVSLAWKAKVLPLNYSRIEPALQAARNVRLPFPNNQYRIAKIQFLLVEEAGFEPA